jgi:hypothetical protein
LLFLNDINCFDFVCCLCVLFAYVHFVIGPRAAKFARE